MALTSQIATLESAGLVTLVGADPDIEYIFRHALIQDAVYDSLLKSEQHNLHHIAGEVLEELYPDRREEQANRLAEHFWLAGEAGRALPYFIIAAEHAERSYANAEAIESYSSALKAADGDTPAMAKILRARGLLYDTTGEFELARLDQEAALKLTETAGDERGTWESLINLGMLWASRDYRQTGKYYSRALETARGFNDDRVLASTLNRLGNYHINVEEPDESQRYHLEALSIFQRLEDDDGIAETDDLLGMSKALGGDLPAAMDYLNQAVTLFEKLGRLHNLSSSLSTMAILSHRYQTDNAVVAKITLEEGLTLGRRAQQIAIDTRWPSGEVFALCNMASTLVALGQYDRALECVNKGIQIAEKIHHRQWQTYTALAAGMLYLDICDFERAQKYIQQALMLARQNHSFHWIDTSSGILADALISNHNLPEAEKILYEDISRELPARTLGQRIVWSARANLALEQGDPEQALAISKKLMDEAIFHNKDDVITRLWMIRGNVLIALAKNASDGKEKKRLFTEAEALLTTALAVTQSMNYRSMTWRLHLALSRLYQADGKKDKAAQSHQSASSIVHELAAQISDYKLKRNFLSRALEG